MNKKEREIFKHKIEQYPVIINSNYDGEGNAKLLHFKDRLEDLNLNLTYGSDLSKDKYKNMSIVKDALYVTGKQLQKPFYLGDSLEEAKITMGADADALDYGESYAKQQGYGILSNKKMGSIIPVYAHEDFDELPTEQDTLDFAKFYNSRIDTSRFIQDNNAERANIESRSNTRSLITNEKHTEASLGQQQKNAIDNYYKNHKLPNGVDFVDLEKLSYNNKFRDNPWIAQDIVDLINHVYNGSKYGVMFTEDNEVAIHNISKKELETISSLEDYEFDPTYKTVAKDLSKVAPEAPDFSIDLGDPMSFDFNVIENDYYIPDKTIDDDRAKANIVLKPTSIIKGLEWNQKQDIYYYNPKNKKEPQLIGKDLESFADYLNEPAKIDGLSTTRVDINREHFAKTHQNQVKNIQRNLYIGRDKNANEDLFKKYLRKYDVYVNPSKKDFEDANVLLGLSKDTNLDKVVEKMKEPKQEKAIGYIKANPKKEKEIVKRKNAKQILEEYGFDATEENIKKMAKNIENEDKFNKQLKIKKTGLESVKLELADPEIRKNYAETYGKKTEIDKKTEQVFLEKPIYSQWFMQRDREEKEYEDLERLGFPSSYQGEEKQKFEKLSQKIPAHTIRKLENAYVATRDIYFDDKTSEVKNISLVSKTTKAKIEKNSKKFLALEHAKQASRTKKLER
ncbi:DUF814 domain-containing protein [Lactobacillus gasseri]|uniref:Uncharacterized protein n=1 Tax=Lactobacillus gasseri SV-16A-US TaxID=575604 RepID=A0AB34NX60_LACGS|nr:DUF814 domain-containing protein [Lactobacillus gasseri]KFL96379.1 hypothetical protein HMPREF5175_01892 [Lactobacillus gasseri SV-16A-US]MCZ3850716.1 DUF814 domain-containing protein [Lactobacillus gasseri]MCZ3852571.1 DUF814 domain-containing protein [Lactobacillus gasseri]MCZ3861183.1 DUF814 domain-containing protein [Lactobacillus gasseri]MCZ3893693.1 DUF814 domain-containing protein [Lactobacillus gasseri]